MLPNQATPLNNPGDNTNPAAGDPRPQNPPAAAATPPTNIGLTEAEVATRLDKVRADEKAKAYGAIEALKKDKQSIATQYQEAEAKLATAQENLDSLREGKSSEVDSIQKELQEMRAKNEKLEKAIEFVATEATDRILKSEVNAYREKVIREKKVELAELVTGSTVEEVDASVDKAIKRGDELEAKFTAAATGILPAVEPTEPAAQLPAATVQQPAPTPQQPAAAPADTSALPRPVSPDGSQGRNLLPELGPLNREALSKLPPAEYAVKRNALLAAAKLKVGLS